jgi:nitric oxide reductase large subunit
LIFLGTWTYTGAPPVVDYVSSTGTTVIPANLIVRGKEVFHLKGLMSWGSFWGDGADRGPDFTAEALHRTVVSMRTFYENELLRRQPVVTQWRSSRPSKSCRCPISLCRAGGDWGKEGMMYLYSASSWHPNARAQR